MHARAGRFNQLIHDLLIRQRVELQADVSLLPVLLVVDLLLDHVKDAVLQALRSHQQMTGLFDGLTLGQRLEYSGRVQADLHIRRHQGQIRIKPRCLLIIVSGADLGNVFDPVPAFLRDQAQLGMNLKAFQAVNDLAARLLKHPGPADVVLLVKPRPQLHKDDDFLAVLSRLAQRLHDLALLCQSVERHLDREDIVILRRLIEQIQERADRFVRIRQQLIALFDLFYNTFTVTE